MVTLLRHHAFVLGLLVQAYHGTEWQVQDTVLCRAVTVLRRLPGHKLGRVSWRRVDCRQDSDRLEGRGRHGPRPGGGNTHDTFSDKSTRLDGPSSLQPRNDSEMCLGRCQEVCASRRGGEARGHMSKGPV